MIKNYIFLGAPGVGKGTMAKLIAKDKDMIHISTGDMFRNHIKNQTEIGKKAKAILDSGDYVPDNITNEMVRQTLLDTTKGIILDGYPRTINQAEFLKSIEFDLTGAVLLLAPDNVIQSRLEFRAKKENRDDDTPAVIAKRIEVYNEKTAPLIKFYRDEGKLIEVDASEDINGSYKELEKVVFND